MTSDLSEKTGKKDLAERKPQAPFSMVLSRTIESIRNDPAQLRNVIYELARIKLQRECLLQNPPMTVLETRRLMLSLETAIERVESTCSQKSELPTLESLSLSIEQPQIHQADAAPLIIDHELVGTSGSVSSSPASSSDARSPESPSRKRPWSRIAPLVQVGFATVIATVLYAVLSGQFDSFHARIRSASTDLKTQSEPPEPKAQTFSSVNQAAPTAAGQASDHAQAPTGPPLPSVYGIYAISNERLYELKPLAGKVPDPRVFMSWAIKTPSRTILPDGHIEFIVYQRGVANSAPDRVSVRVIAKVLRSMSFNSAGLANTTPLDDAWAIRNISYDLRVAPVSDNPEMLILKNEDPDFSFSAGRYGLVLKGQAYDFTIAGQITEPAQCLERVEAVNGAFYTECKTP